VSINFSASIGPIESHPLNPCAHNSLRMCAMGFIPPRTWFPAVPRQPTCGGSTTRSSHAAQYRDMVWYGRYSVDEDPSQCVLPLLPGRFALAREVRWVIKAQRGPVTQCGATATRRGEAYDSAKSNPPSLVTRWVKPFNDSVRFSWRTSATDLSLYPAVYSLLLWRKIKEKFQYRLYYGHQKLHCKSARRKHTRSLLKVREIKNTSTKLKRKKERETGIMSEITLKEKIYLIIAIIKTTIQVLCKVLQMYRNSVIIFVKSNQRYQKTVITCSNISKKLLFGCSFTTPEYKGRKSNPG